MIPLWGIKMKTKHVVVKDYDPYWRLAYQEIEGYIRTLVPKSIFIEHVGSTSVQGLSAKPIIDLDVLYENEEDFAFVLDALKKLGYTYEGEMGIPFRHAFAYQDLPLMKHHLYLVKKGSKAHLDHVYFRDYLCAHEEKRRMYGELKSSLAKKFPFDIDSYMLGKEDFIQKTLMDAYSWSMEKEQ